MNDQQSFSYDQQQLLKSYQIPTDLTKLPPKIPKKENLIVVQGSDELSDSFLSDFLKDSFMKKQKDYNQLSLINSEDQHKLSLQQIDSSKNKSRNIPLGLRRSSIKQIKAVMFNTCDVVLTPTVQKSEDGRTSAQEISYTNGFHESTAPNSIRRNSKLLSVASQNLRILPSSKDQNQSDRRGSNSTLWNLKKLNLSQITHSDQESIFQRKRNSEQVIDTIRSRLSNMQNKVEPVPKQQEQNQGQIKLANTQMQSPQIQKDLFKKTGTMIQKLFHKNSIVPSSQTMTQEKQKMLRKSSGTNPYDHTIRQMILLQYKEMRQSQNQIKLVQEIFHKGLLKLALKHYKIYQEWADPHKVKLKPPSTPLRQASKSKSRQIKVINTISQQALQQQAQTTIQNAVLQKPIKKLVITTLSGISSKTCVATANGVVVSCKAAQGKRFFDFLPPEKRIKLQGNNNKTKGQKNL